MAYIGNTPDAIQTTIEITRFNGTGACTEFQIPQDVDDAKAIEVLVNSVQQDPDNSYTVTNGLITFTEAPSVGTNNVTVLRRTGITFTRTQIDASDILPNAVTNDKLNLTYSSSEFLADGSGNIFTVNTGHDANSILVFVNGICMLPVTDYGVSGTTLTLAFTPVANSNVSVRYFPV